MDDMSPMGIEEFSGRNCVLYSNLYSCAEAGSFGIHFEWSEFVLLSVV